MRQRLVAVALGTVLAGASSGAQVMASEHATVSQTIDGATITVQYYRPVARGRTIFGKVVRPGETWTPGANWATTLETDRDVRVEGRPLAKGTYSVWLHTGKDSAWTMLFSRTAHRFHMVPPDSTDVALSVPVRPEQSATSEEALTWSFPDVRRDTTTLRMQWTTTAVALHVTVDPPPVAALAPDVAARYVGAYRLTFTGDTTSYGLEVRRGPNGLLATLDSLALEPGQDPHMDLIPKRTDVFLQGDYQQGRFVGVEVNDEWRFVVRGGRAVALELRSLVDDRVIARGVRRM